MTSEVSLFGCLLWCCCCCCLVDFVTEVDVVVVATAQFLTRYFSPAARVAVSHYVLSNAHEIAA